MQSLVLVFHVLVAIAIIALVLLQHGRGSDVGAAFGSGASNTMFGSAGALPFLMKLTVACAAIFFVTSITLSDMAARHAKSEAKIMQMPASVPGSASSASKPAKQQNTNESMGIAFTPTVQDKK